MRKCNDQPIDNEPAFVGGYVDRSLKEQFTALCDKHERSQQWMIKKLMQAVVADPEKWIRPLMP